MATKGNTSQIDTAKSELNAATQNLATAPTDSGTPINTADLQNMAVAMLPSDAEKIIQATVRYRNNDKSALTELDDYTKKYGADYFNIASQTLWKTYNAPTQFANDTIYNTASNIRDAAVVNDPTWTSPEQAQIAQISNATTAQAGQMYAQRKADMANQMPKYQPLSTDPDQNQLFLGMAMQGAAGLLALLDPEAAAVAASSVSASTIDAMYDRKIRIDSTNKELQKKYMDLMTDYSKRDDALWKDYYDSVMKERGDLRGTMRELLNNEMDAADKRAKNRIEAAKAEVEAQYKQGQLTNTERKNKIDSLDKTAEMKFKVWQEYMKDKNEAEKLRLWWGQLANQKNNELLKYYMPNKTYKNLRTVAEIGPNMYSLKGMDQNRKGYNQSAFFSAETDSAVEQQEILAKYKDDIDAITVAKDPSQKKLLMSELERKIATDWKAYTPPPNIASADKDSNEYLGYMAGMQGTFGKLYEDIANQNDNIGKQEIVNENRKEMSAFANSLREQGFKGEKFHQQFIMKYPNEKFYQEIVSQMAGGEE